MTHSKVKKIVLLILGWGFIVLGIVGLFLPFLQGILFLLVGLVLLSREYVWAQRVLDKVRARFPAAAGRIEEASHKAHLWVSQLLARISRSK